MPHKTHRRYSSSTDGSTDSDPPSDDPSPSDSDRSSDDSFREKGRHGGRRRSGGGRSSGGRRSESSSGGGSSDSESSGDGAVHDRHHRKHKRKRRRAAAAGPPPSSNTNLFLLAGGLVLLVALGAGGYYWYTHRDASASTDSGSTSGSSGSAGSGSTGSDSGSGSGAGSSGGAGSGGKSKAASSAGGTAKSSAASGSATGTATAAAASGTGSSSSSGGGSGNILGFWENYAMTAADTKFEGYTHCSYFTSVPGTADEKGKLTTGQEDDQVKAWVTAAKAGGCKTMLTVGGWSGSSTFTKLVATDTSRSDFAGTIDEALSTYGFDGVDIDWEYPGAAGATSDFDTTNDLANLLLFFQTLRDKIGTDKLISADTSSTVWVGSDGSPSTDLADFGDVLDYIMIMTYDAVNAAATTTGPNFPYSADCAPSGSLALPTTVQAWIDAKFPANKIMVGLASYGYGWQVASLSDNGVSGAKSTIYQTATKTTAGNDGTFTWDVIQSGVRVSSFHLPSFLHFSKNMTYTYDNCTATPYLYSDNTKLFIAYDDETSFGTKGSVATTDGLFGCGIYAGLTQDKDGTLLAAAKKVC
ncbi:hypothetical protein JCM8097_004389 [Rhodosporidiobolus ruineniae]